MSGETPRDSSTGTPQTSEGDAIATPAPTVTEVSPSPEPSAVGARMPPSIPRPARKQAFADAATGGAAAPASSQLPPPAALPRVPGVEALMAGDSDSAAPSPPAIPSFAASPSGPTASPTIPRPAGSAPGSSPEGGAARRKSRRNLKIPDDVKPAPISSPTALDASEIEHFEMFTEPAAIEPELDSPFALTRTSSPAPSPPPPPIQASPSPRPSPLPIMSADPDEVIRPMRIINISEENAVEVSARTSNLPPEGDFSPWASEGIPEPPPSIPTEIDAVEVVEEDEPAPQIEAVEEIDVRISEVDPEERAATAPQPKKPPPPPPKRPSMDGGAPVSSRPPEATAPTPPPAPPAAPAAAAAPADKPALSLDPARKRQKPWWEELFGDDFLRTMDHPGPNVIHKECDFIEDRLGLERGAVMLDLACGPGSHAVELASRGYSVVGYDLSLAMLARAADEAQERSQKLNFLQGDMREMAFEETFDGVYCWSTSFGYFDDEKNLNVLLRIRRALRKGGMLLLDLINRDYVAPRQPSLVWFEGEGCVCMDEMFVDFFTSRLRVKRTVMFEDGRSKEVDYAIRLYALHELGKMLHECGFKVVEVTGHPAHPGVFFGSESPRIIVLAERD